MDEMWPGKTQNSESGPGRMGQCQDQPRGLLMVDFATEEEYQIEQCPSQALSCCRETWKPGLT